MVDKDKILAGRQAVGAYRQAHAKLYVGGWHKDIPEEHTPLLEKLVADLEKQGYTSAHIDFKAKSAEVLMKFWVDSDLINLQELGYKDRADFKAKIGELPDEEKGVALEALRVKWS